MPVALSMLFFVLALAGVGLNIYHPPVGGAVIKSLPAIFLAICAWGYSRPRFGFWVVVGVALGAVGDYSLANAERAWFMTGLGAFLVGHIAYSVAFAKELRWTRTRGAVIGATTALMVVLTVAVCVRMVHRAEYGIIAPVIVYVSVMCVMMTLAVLHDSPTWLIAAGGVIFVISDAHIAVNHMLLSSSRLSLALSGYTTYYLAQYLLVAGAIYEARRWTQSRGF